MAYTQKSELEKLGYVAMRVELERESSDNLAGLFLGYKPLVTVHTDIASNDEIFLWLAKGDQIHIVSLDHYKVIGIETGYKNGHSMISRSVPTRYWSKDSAIEEIVSLQNELLSRGWVTSKGLIDITKYESVPENLKSAVEDKTTIPAAKNHNRSSGQWIGASGSTASKPVALPVKKTVSTATIKRTTRYDVTKAIGEMQKKIALLREGKYEPPKLRALAEPESQKKMTNQNQCQTESSEHAAGSSHQYNKEVEDQLDAMYGLNEFYGTD